MKEFYLPSFDGKYAEQVEFRIKHKDAYKTVIFVKIDDAGTYELSDIIYDGCVPYMYKQEVEEMTRERFLDEAKKCVCTDREGQYGTPEDNFALIAAFWNEYLESKYPDIEYSSVIEACDVAMMMALLKVARIATGKPKADNYVDLIGYAACGGEIQLREA